MTLLSLRDLSVTLRDRPVFTGGAGRESHTGGRMRSTG